MVVHLGDIAVAVTDAITTPVLIHTLLSVRVIAKD